VELRPAGVRCADEGPDLGMQGQGRR
jgi:hypothetical protein